MWRALEALEVNAMTGGRIWATFRAGEPLKREDLDIAIRAHRRHVETDYEDRLREGLPREQARVEAEPLVLGRPRGKGAPK